MTTEMNNGVAEGETPVEQPFSSLEHTKFSQHFTYHKPNPKQIPRYNAINNAAKAFAEAIAENVPEDQKSIADKTAALRLVVQAKMAANSAIATNPEAFS